MAFEIMTLSEAIRSGSTRYFTGKPCKRGHIAQRNTITSVCLKCMTIHQKTRRQKIYEAKQLTSLGTIEISVKVFPKDVRLLQDFVELLNAYHLDGDGINYIQMLNDYAYSLLQARKLK